MSAWVQRCLGAAYEVLKQILVRLLYHLHKWRYRFAKSRSARLHVGCGKNHLPGWINADIIPSAELIVFLEKRLPLRGDCLDRIYCEHVLEHVSFETGVFFLREARRTLRVGGRIRIAVPDLEDLVAGYFHQDWRSRFDWVNWPGHEFITTRAQMINIGFRWWGHQHLYDREELERALSEAGFVDFQFLGHGQSAFDDLRGLESRADSTLIVEAAKS